MGQTHVYDFLNEMKTKGVEDFFSVKQIFLALETRGANISLATTGVNVRKLYAWGLLEIKFLKLSTGGYSLTYRLKDKNLKDSSIA